MKKKQPTVLEAADLVAFISLNQKIQPKPFIRRSDNKVCFAFEEDVSPSIDAFYQNVQIPVADFCKNLKLVRSMIFNLKAGG